MVDLKMAIMKAIANEVKDLRLLEDSPRSYWIKQHHGLDIPIPAIEGKEYFRTEYEVLRGRIQFGLNIAELLGYISNAEKRYRKIDDRMFERGREKVKTGDN